MEEFIGRLNYFIYIALMMVGLYGMIGKKNLVKKVTGMNIFQWSIILFFVRDLEGHDECHAGRP